MLYRPLRNDICMYLLILKTSFPACVFLDLFVLNRSPEHCFQRLICSPLFLVATLFAAKYIQFIGRKTMYIVSAIVTIVFEVAFGTVDFLGVGARLEARGEKPIFRPPDIRDMSFAPLLNVMCLNWITFPSFSSIYILQIIDILTYDQCSKRKCYLRVLGVCYTD